MTALASRPDTAALDAREALARALAEAAGRTARAFFEARGDLKVEEKGEIQDWVSRADREVEAEIRAAVKAAFPDDGMLGEEEGLVAGTSGFTWVVDPIDGTLPFLTGQPNWCVSVAVTGPDAIEIGVIVAPVAGETFAARRGRGATLNGAPLAMDPATLLTSGNVGFGHTQSTDPEETGRAVAELYRRGGVFYRVGSGALMLAYVAAGRLAGYFDPRINSYDCYAGLLLVEEAGGVARFEGGLMEKGALMAGTPAVVAELIAIRDFAVGVTRRG